LSGKKKGSAEKKGGGGKGVLRRRSTTTSCRCKESAEGAVPQKGTDKKTRKGSSRARVILEDDVRRMNDQTKGGRARRTSVVTAAEKERGRSVSSHYTSQDNIKTQDESRSKGQGCRRAIMLRLPGGGLALHNVGNTHPETSVHEEGSCQGKKKKKGRESLQRKRLKRGRVGGNRSLAPKPTK